jgi:hypothetical protein
VGFRTYVARVLVGAAIFFTALVAVGITASDDGIFTIAIRPVFMRIDPAAIAESRARALGLDVDVKLGGMHLHLGWSAIRLSPESANADQDLF